MCRKWPGTLQAPAALQSLFQQPAFHFWIFFNETWHIWRWAWQILYIREHKLGSCAAELRQWKLKLNARLKRRSVTYGSGPNPACPVGFWEWPLHVADRVRFSGYGQDSKLFEGAPGGPQHPINCFLLNFQSGINNSKSNGLTLLTTFLVRLFGLVLNVLCDISPCIYRNKRHNGY
jgi:hypothetical protein